MKMNECHNDGARMVPGTAELKKTIGGRTFSAEVPALVCPTCGEKVTEYRDGAVFELAVATVLAREGPIDNETFRFMRSILRLKGTDLAELLDVTSVTISKWENDKTPVPRAAWLVLAELVLDEAGGERAPLRERLQAVTSTRARSKRVSLKPLGKRVTKTTEKRAKRTLRAGMTKRARG